MVKPKSKRAKSRRLKKLNGNLKTAIRKSQVKSRARSRARRRSR